MTNERPRLSRITPAWPATERQNSRGRRLTECGLNDTGTRPATQAVQVFNRITTNIRPGGLRGAHKSGDVVALSDEFVNDFRAAIRPS
jgi:hypothetical protein